MERGENTPTTPEADPAAVIEPISSEESQPASADGQEAEEDGRPKTEEDGRPGTEDGQEMQMVQVRQMSHARQLELAEQFVLDGGLMPPRHKGAHIMNIRELMAQRAAKIARARELANLADGEKRDFAEEERLEYQAALDDAQKLGEKITQIQTERETLQNAEESLTGLASTAEKPAPGAVKTMKRSEYDKLEALDQGAFVKAGGKITD
jgi:hypothetical protein